MAAMDCPRHAGDRDSRQEYRGQLKARRARLPGMKRFPPHGQITQYPLPACAGRVPIVAAFVSRLPNRSTGANHFGLSLWHDKARETSGRFDCPKLKRQCILESLQTEHWLRASAKSGSLRHVGAAGEPEIQAWKKHMNASMDDVGIDGPARRAMRGFFCGGLQQIADSGRYDVSVPELKQLLAHDRSVANAETPLRRALNCRQPGMIELLLARGANLDSPDKHGVTPRQVATKRGLPIGGV